MKIKKIRSTQLPNCHYCKMERQKVSAVWHLTGECKQSCDKHKPMLERIRERAREGTTHYTEADYQTWMRL